MGQQGLRFAVGETVRVIGHPARPLGTVTDRWPGSALQDPYGENIYQVSSFVTKLSESSLAPAPDGRGAATRWFRMRFGHVAGIVFNYRLTFGVVAARVGLHEGLLTERLCGATLRVILAGAILPSFLLRGRPDELS